MPTKLPRHTITETPPISLALRLVRPLYGREVKKSEMLGELIALGAKAKLEQTQREEVSEEERRAARVRFAERALTGEGIDFDALREVRETGWVRPQP